jgi:hypothetical protein
MKPRRKCRTEVVLGFRARPAASLVPFSFLPELAIGSGADPG